MSKPNLLKEVVVYMFLVLGVFLLVTIPVGMFQNLDKITQRWTESSKVAFSSFDNWGYIKNLFWETRSFWIVIVLGLGFGFANKRKLWNIEIVVALSWVLLTLVVFCFQKPLWYHYALLFTVPCYWIVTDSIQQIILFLEKYLKNKVHIVSTIAVLTLCFVGYKKATDMGETITSDYHNSDLRKMFSAHVPSDILMFTDRPYYGVMNGNQIIPELAVFTKTRFMSGHMTYPYFISLLDKYQPEYIVLGRYKLEDYELPFRNYLLKNYSHTHSEGKVMSFSKK